MDQYIFFAVAAIIVSIIRYITYFYTLFKGDTKPHAFSWLLWGSVTGVGTIVQLSLDAGPSTWALGFVSVTCLLISVISFFIGEKTYTKSDWVALIACFLAIPIWQATNDPLLALLIIMTIDVLSFWPTIRKSFNKPDTEPPLSFGFAGLRYFFMLLAVPDPEWSTLMYPFFLMASDWGFAIYIVIRRAQLGMPLHEYAKDKAEKSA